MPRKPRVVADETPHPSVELFRPETTDKPWGDEVLVAKTGAYTGKVLRRYDGDGFHRAGLQYHPTRDETFHLLSGRAWVYFVQDGLLKKLLLKEGMSVHVPPGAIHSVQTLGDSIMFEASVPDDTEPRTVNVESEWNIADAVIVAEMPERRITNALPPIKTAESSTGVRYY